MTTEEESLFANLSSNTKTPPLPPMEDYEWDESKATVTTWTSFKNDSKSRGKRTYGRRNSNKTLGKTTTNVASVPPKRSGGDGRINKKRVLHERQENHVDELHNDSSRLQRAEVEHDFKERDGSLNVTITHNQHSIKFSSMDQADGTAAKCAVSHLSLSSSDSISSSHDFPVEVCHHRSKSTSCLPDRPPIYEKPRRCSPAKNQNRRYIEHFIEGENLHPNVLEVQSSDSLSPFPPTKLKKIMSSPAVTYSSHQHRKQHLYQSRGRQEVDTKNIDEEISFNLRKKGNIINGDSKQHASRKLHNSSSTVALSPNNIEERPLSPTFSAHSGSSFSSLSRTGDIAPTWMKQALQDCVSKITRANQGTESNYHKNNKSISRIFHNIAVDLADLGATPTSPARSVSSRKRGVCESPLLDHADDVSSTGGLSISRHSTSSYGSRRARSRIFSPDSTKKIMEATANTMYLGKGSDENDFSGHDNANIPPMGRIRRNSLNVSDSESDSNSVLIKPLHSFDSHETNEDGESDSDHETKQLRSTQKMMTPFQPPPSRPRRMSSVGDGSFAQNVFSPVDNDLNSSPTNNRKNKSKSVLNVFENISSYDDLKFLIKELRRWQNGKNPFASFGMSKTCTIVPPNAWPSSRKANFITWTTQELGLCLRSGGATVNYLQTNSAKALEILKDLEEVLLRHKLNAKKKGELNSKSMQAKDMYDDLVIRNKKEEFQVAPLSSIKIMSNDAPLFQMTMSELRSGTRRRTSMSSRHSFSPINHDSLDENLTSKFTSLNIKAQHDDLKPNIEASFLNSPNECNAREDDRSTPLVRIVTLENGTCSIKGSGTSISGHYRPRLSSEHSVMDTRDFVSHMHGVSPNDNNNIDRCRPSRLVIPLNQQKLTVSSVFSPYCNQRAGEVNCTSASAALSFDEVETPMPKQNLAWGSRPVLGKDWGLSMRCSENVCATLFSRVEEACAGEYCNSSPQRVTIFQKQHSIHDSSSCLVHPSISKTAANSETLGFDFEADNAPRLDKCENENDSSSETDVEGYDEDDFDEDVLFSKDMKRNQESIGASAFAELDLNDEGPSPENIKKRQRNSMAKRHRMSICASAMDPIIPIRLSTINSKSFLHDIVAEQEFVLHNGEVQNHDHPWLQSKSCRSVSFENIRDSAVKRIISLDFVLTEVFSFLNEQELLCTASVVSTKWADAATDAHASLMLVSVGCCTDFIYGNSAEVEETKDDDDISLEDEDEVYSFSQNSISKSMERPWNYLVDRFPWANFLSEGAFKRVYRVWNSYVEAEEAVSVMNVDLIDNKNVVGAELAVSVMLSSLVRRNICPNFVLTRGVFTSPYEPPASYWGSAEDKNPMGSEFDPFSAPARKPREPEAENRGLFQYIRMELCRHGDIEEFIRKQQGCVINPNEARMLLFQMAFSLHVAGDRFAMKHYDVKLLNFFLQSTPREFDIERHPFTSLRYGVGSHVFNLRMPSSRVLIAKLADYGTANVRSESDGQPVILGNFTTIENSPPEYLILGDAAKQGYGHDCFGLGLCMLHLFTGHAPYEEILEDVTCPPNFKKKLKRVWDHQSSSGYEVVRSVILSDVSEDEDGNIEGEPDEVLYDTLYRFLVLFGIPKNKFQPKEGGKVWRAISSCLETDEENASSTKRPVRRINSTVKQPCSDNAQFKSDCDLYSVLHGKDERIACARKKLEMMDGGMDLLFSLVSFDPSKRATALDVINSKFMAPLRQDEHHIDSLESDKVYSYMAYATKTSA